ncbi:MAG: hypothetical protein MUC50_05615, partial [Myxococcota bacterium]|nr:hypothetical protein [Myxococcota bacterium]
VIDDQDNLYFWTARGRLHSVDKRGKLRWRLDLCDAGPPYDKVFTPKELPMIMDFHGTLYFFVGDELYGVRGSDGKVLLQRRIIIPGVRPDPRGAAENLTMAEGERVTFFQYHGLAPVLGADGTLYAAFQLSGSGERIVSSGYLHLSRLGDALAVFTRQGLVSVDSIVGDHKGRVIGSHTEVRVVSGQLCDEDAEEQSVRVVSVIAEEGWTQRDGNQELHGRVVSKTGMVYSVDGRLFQYSADTPSKRLVDIASQDVDSSEINAFNRPVMDRDGFIYVTRDQGYSTGVGLIALDPVKIEAGVTDPKAYLLTMPNAPGYLWGLRVPYPALNATTPVITKSGILYTALGGSLLALQLKEGGAQPTVTWEYIAPGGLYPTTMHVLSDGTLLIGDDSGWLYFLRDGIDNGGLDTQAAWPRPYHDNYRSNNASHPMKWDRAKPAPYPSLEELLEEARAGWNCNTDNRCYPKKYYETCDWGGDTDWAGDEVSCGSKNAIATPCPKENDPRRTVCLATDDLAVHPCDAPPSDPQNCNCATPGAIKTSTVPWLGLALCLAALAAIVLRVRRQ